MYKSTLPVYSVFGRELHVSCRSLRGKLVGHESKLIAIAAPTFPNGCHQCTIMKTDNETRYTT